MRLRTVILLVATILALYLSFCLYKGNKILEITSTSLEEIDREVEKMEKEVFGLERPLETKGIIIKGAE